MKTTICLTSLLLVLALPAGAALYSSGNLAGTVIPDNNYLGTGTTLQYTFSGIGSEITGLTLNFTLAGGYGGDLSGYLRLGDQPSSPYYDLTSTVQAYPTISGSGVNFTVNVASAFTGQDPNGIWTLFFADNSPVGQTTVNGWSLDVTAVPEPVNVALVVFGGIIVLAGGRQWWLKSQLDQVGTKQP